MGVIYFIDEEHRENFKKVTVAFPASKVQVEYRAASYILSVPMIFEKVKPYYMSCESPIAWIMDYELNHLWTDDMKAEEGYKLPPYDLTNSMLQLGKLALNLWNGYEHFNLMDCLKAMDQQHIEVVKCAIDIRSERKEE